MSQTDYAVVFGGIRIRVRDLRRDLARPLVSLAEPIAKYLADADGPADLDFVVETLDNDPPAIGRLLFDSGNIWRLFDDGDVYRIECRVPGILYKVAFFSKDLTRGTLRMRELDD